ncbi:uncharacterized protein DFL_007512 [Arthrobotrys flagrans]|uniref:Uncharacterized protein n=1 Tax=Arthrobotrys flagrans TaxID=97331 RepID=A0A436ZVV8_ARTFL|nr:hypothetical protein DFL_007512 [Arthrobotrys flagrans]
MPPKRAKLGASSAIPAAPRYFLRSKKKSKYRELPPETRQNILKGILLDSVVKFRHRSQKATRDYLLSKIALTKEDYEKFTEKQVMNERDIDDYVEFLYHQDCEACVTCPKKQVLGKNDCRCPAVTRLYPIPTNMLLVSKAFREDVLAAYHLVQQMATGIIESNKVPPSTFRSQCEWCYTPDAANRTPPPGKGFNNFSRDLIERSLYPSSPVC